MLNEHCRIPLLYAASSGHEGVVKILGERDDANLDKLDKRCRTLLLCAASDGYEGVAKIPLEQNDVNPEKPDKHSQTPLWGIAETPIEWL